MIINVGDQVEIIECGESYTGWYEQADKMKLTNYNRMTDWKSTQGCIGKVVAKDIHKDDRRVILYGIYIPETKRHHIINHRGVKLYKKMNILPEDLFEL